jgi:hypothetical protein
MDKSTKYRIRFRLKDKTVITWERMDSDMENCLKSTKQEIANKYGNEWQGGAAICGPQGDGSTYNF